MAKGDVKVEQVKIKKPRTAVQKAADEAKKERNIRLANERLERLQMQQRIENEAKAAAIAQAARQEAEAAYVQSALNGPHAAYLRGWLVLRMPTFERVSRFFAERPNLTAPDTFVRRAA